MISSSQVAETASLISLRMAETDLSLNVPRGIHAG